MIKSIDTVESEHFKRELYHDLLEQCMATSYLEIDTSTTGSYTGTNKMVDFTLA